MRAASRADKTILVIDDEPMIREAIRLALTRSGYQVLTAPDGRTGVELFRQHGPQVDAVLLDLAMPEPDGAEVLTTLREIQQDVRVILSSGQAETETLEHFGHLDLAGFLHKPFRPVELIDTLDQVLGSNPAK
ncbi:MAG TPA: response regulator [Planctomycetaceae bacterium]|nr:response regulator [Planctomycetaceae bacterium]